MDIKAYISSGIIEQYALGIATPEEASILECVMKHNSEVEKAILEAQETLGDLALANSVAPSIELKDKIASKLNFDIPEEIGSLDNSSIKMDSANYNINDSKSKSSNFWMIAASIILLVSLGWNVLNTTSKNTEIETLAQNNEALKVQIDAVEQQNNILLNSEKIKLLGVETHPELLATILYSADQQVFLQVGNLPPTPAGKEYQLWAIVDGTPVDLGMYNDKNLQKLQAMKAVQNPQAFAITLENKGGSPTPTMNQMYVLGKVG